MISFILLSIIFINLHNIQTLNVCQCKEFRTMQTCFEPKKERRCREKFFLFFPFLFSFLQKKRGRTKKKEKEKEKSDGWLPAQQKKSGECLHKKREKKKRKGVPIVDIYQVFETQPLQTVKIHVHDQLSNGAFVGGIKIHPVKTRHVENGVFFIPTNYALPCIKLIMVVH